MGGKSFKDLYQALFSFRLSSPILFKNIWNGKLILTARWWRSKQKEKQKNIYLNKLSNISVWKQTFFRGWKKNENKTKSSLQIRIWKCDNKKTDCSLCVLNEPLEPFSPHRMISSAIRMTSLIECPAWLKCKETGVGSLSCWWLNGSAVFSKSFI